MRVAETHRCRVAETHRRRVAETHRCAGGLPRAGARAWTDAQGELRAAQSKLPAESEHIRSR